MPEGFRRDAVKPRDTWVTPVNLSLIAAGLIIIHSAFGLILDHVREIDPGTKLADAMKGISVPLGDDSAATKAIDLCTRAQAAGVDFVDPTGNVDRTLENMLQGGTAQQGPFAGSYFQLTLPETEVPRLEKRLRIRDGRLERRPE